MSPQQLAHQHFQRGNLAEAESLYRQALTSNQNDPDSLRMLAWVVAVQGRLNESIALYQGLLQMYPRDAVSWLQMGNVLLHQGQIEEAIEAYRQSARWRPDYPDAYYNLGNAFRMAGKLDDSVDAFRRAVELKPDYANAWANLGNARKDVGQLTEAIENYRQALSIQPDARTASNLLYALQFHPAYDARQILQEHRQWNQMYAERFRPSAGSIRQRTNHRRLRIGYVSADLRDHPVGRSMIPLLEHRDRERFEVVCYSDVRNPDAVTQRLQTNADIWRDASSMSDDQLAALIRDDEPNILIDLGMHMGGNRLLTFAQKPAPVQACWQAYPGTTGLWAMDYRLTDPFVDPPGATDANYSERSIRLRDSFWIYQPLSDEPKVNQLPAESAGFVTFGCLNNFCKINVGVLSLWSEVMLAIPRSRLVVLAPEGSARQRLADRMESNGVDRARLEYVGRQAPADYLRTYHRIDIGLDTFPYNGHMTSLDSMWMGVPVITRIGNTVVGRAGWSQLCNLGVKELAASDDQQFVEIARELANNLPRLAVLRATLRHRMESSPLMNGKRYSQAAEAAYLQMWTEHR